MAARKGRIDPIVLEILWSRLTSMVTEQAASIVRTSFSPVVREAGDVATAVFDASGRMLAHGLTGTPGHIVPMRQTLGHFLAEFPADTLRPGDIFITNDPWRTTGHLFDITIAVPVFFRRKLVAFLASTAHHVDVGGLGFGASAHDVFEEGLFIPVMKFYHGGRMDEGLRRLLRANVREPDIVLGDLNAQVAANEMAGETLRELLAEYRLADLKALADEIFRISEHASRKAIREIPDGTYGVEVDLDGYEKPITVALSMKIRGDDIIADYTGTSPQSRNGINVCLNYTAGYTAFAVRCAIGREIPNNHGSLAPLRVVAPPGTVVNCTFPAPVSARHVVGQMIPGIVLQALAKAIPEQVMADGAGSVWALAVQGHSVEGRPFAGVMLAAGGMGARPGKDGLTTTQYPVGTRAVPIEIMELVSPVVYRRKEIVADSGGAGQYRGGLAQRITLEVRPGDRRCMVNMMGDRTRFPGNGLLGGSPGARGRAWREDGGPFDAKARITLDDNVTLHLETPGGGGFGPPFERDPERVVRDVSHGYVSREAAERDYGVALAPDGSLDGAKTERLREPGRHNPARRTRVRRSA